jgi:heme exporter protein A
MLEIVDLACIRGDRKLFSGLNFSLIPGSLLYIKGHNGSGKTTLLRTICGLFLAEEGEIRWAGENVRSLCEDYNKEVLYLGHHNGIKYDLTGYQSPPDPLSDKIY